MRFLLIPLVLLTACAKPTADSKCQNVLADQGIQGARLLLTESVRDGRVQILTYRAPEDFGSDEIQCGLINGEIDGVTADRGRRTIYQP